MYVLFGATACSTSKVIQLSDSNAQGACNPKNIRTIDDVRFADLTVSKIPPLSELNRYFSPASLQVAKLIGATELLNGYYHGLQLYKEDSSLANRLRILEYRQKMVYRVSVASLEVASVESELDCELERAHQVADYLLGKKGNREKKLTVGAIVVTAAGAVLTGLLKSKDYAADRIGIASGLIGAGLGVMALTGDKKVAFEHPENALADIWHQPEVSKIFPPHIWYFLTTAKSDTLKNSSLRARLIGDWQRLDQLPPNSKMEELQEAANLYFGTGGIYNADQLNNRADMLDQLIAAINLLTQDLRLLLRETEAMGEQFTGLN
jgi:hypothetical protein